MESLNESFVSLHWQKGKMLTVGSWLAVILTFGVLGFIPLLALDHVLLPWALTLGQDGVWGRGQFRRQREIKCSPPDNRQAQVCLTGSPGAWTTPSVKLSSLVDCPVLPPRPLLHLLFRGLVCLCPPPDQLNVIILYNNPLHL